MRKFYSKGILKDSKRKPKCTHDVAYKLALGKQWYCPRCEKNINQEDIKK